MTVIMGTPPVGSSPQAAIVTVGDELLLGDTVDTNAAWLGRYLAGLGIPVARRFTVGDVREHIQVAVSAATDVADLVLVSGGLGPTPDDITREAVAGLLGLATREDPELVEALRARFRAFGIGEFPESNRAQAMVPDGARVLDNPRGSAPGLAMTRGDTLIVLLPGVPRELRSIMEGSFRAALGDWLPRSLDPVGMRTLHTTGIAESVLSERVANHLAGYTGPVTMAFLPDLRGVDIRLTVTGLPPEDAERSLDEAERLLSPAVDRWRFISEGGDLGEAVIAELERLGLDLAVAESCTGGLIQKRLTDLPGASRVFMGGVVAYADSVKAGLLGVPA
ncbi:MAG: molybdopterin-binding protein, partial [Gemmatimonadota bacterium]|nr:molybdopterin-binding protein [Gemmatimonadota bacterium]